MSLGCEGIREASHLLAYLVRPSHFSVASYTCCVLSCIPIDPHVQFGFRNDSDGYIRVIFARLDVALMQFRIRVWALDQYINS